MERSVRNWPLDKGSPVSGVRFGEGGVGGDIVRGNVTFWSAGGGS